MAAPSPPLAPVNMEIMMTISTVKLIVNCSLTALLPSFCLPAVLPGITAVASVGQVKVISLSAAVKSSTWLGLVEIIFASTESKKPDRPPEDWQMNNP